MKKIELLTTGKKVLVQAKIIDSKLERDEIKYRIELPKMWFTEEELKSCEDEEE